jgi:regulator of protease activity HflC (stomatin/prohibitin superfamily)
MSDLVSRIAALTRSFPTRAADDEAWAAWFVQKAETYEAIAAHDPSIAAEATRIAAKARADALRARQGDDLDAD